MRGSKIYVRRPMDLRAWSLRLRAWIEKSTMGSCIFLCRNTAFLSAE
ncbi:hypothetical protein HMPREF3185_00485 [Porphyromonas somerae]|uniref:Uncharacterized protein n=1 Tax=Porphyromonas somerae TaxID=322095 RepID=A0A134BCC6_9PORP|nr:hypothetical protein HMPREF3184_00485 [Porphyromonadaceae bacterium KA00676]KXB77603.1 hypothetical protein HMPREF3185_00485 [Porphyromonas somerae]